MNIPIDEILAVVREASEPRAAFEALCALGNNQAPSFDWSSIKPPDGEADVEAARAWLERSIADYRPTGVYLGVDTLNENGGTGSNFEIGMTTKADPHVLAMDWAWKCERYGDKHLIRGLYEIHEAYRGLDSDHRLLGDYLFYFGYSGVVLASALERLPVRSDSLFLWGFHDGDLLFLARGSEEGITRLASLPEG